MNETRGLWRGKRVDYCDWILGDLLQIPNLGKDGKIDGTRTAIMERTPEARCYYVDPSTIGECTSLCDKNGHLIFEGDIVEINHQSIHKVVWDDFCWNLENFYASCFDYPTIAFSEVTKYMQ